MVGAGSGPLSRAAAGDGGSAGEVTPAHLQQYQIALYNFTHHDDKEAAATKEKTEPKRLSVGTQANRLAAVRKFFSWLLSEQQIAYNPASTCNCQSNRNACRVAC